MSDYFGALLRSSGLGAPQPPAGGARNRAAAHGVATAQPPAHAGDAHRHDPTAKAAATPTVRAAATAATRPADTRPAADALVPPAAARPHADPIEQLPAGPHVAADTPPPAVVHVPPFAVTPVPAGQPPHAAAMAMAALQWVAADPLQQPPSRRLDLPTSPGPDVTRGPPAGGVPPPWSAAPAPRPVPPHPSAVALTPAHAWPTPTQAPPPARDEPVVVTIGAIHLRMDAPPRQTVAQAQPQPQAQPPAAHAVAGQPPGAWAQPPRSPLSRRALRRF